MIDGWSLDARGGFRRDESAVSEVLGTVLLVAITVVMAAGFALLLGSFGKPTNLAHTDLDIRIDPGEDGWGTDDESVIVRHMGGESLDSSTTALIIRIGSDPEVRFSGEGLESFADFADGSFKIGESIVVGPIRIEATTKVEVLMTSGDGGSSIVGANTISPGTGTVPPVINYFYPGTVSLGHGTLTDPSSDPSFDSLKTEDGITGILEEVDIPVPSPDVREASSASGTAQSPNNALESDDAYAVLRTSGETVSVAGWGPGSATIDSVTAFIESKYVGASSGHTNDVVRFTYDDGTTSVVLDEFVPTASDSVRPAITLSPPGGLWTWQDIANISLGAEYVFQTPQEDNRDFHIDAMWIEIDVSGNVQSLEATFGFTGVGAGSHQVEAFYSSTDETFRIDVLDPTSSTWRSCATLPVQGTLTLRSGCILTAQEYNSGAPTLRLVDAESSTAQGTITLDYVRIKATS